VSKDQGTIVSLPSATEIKISTPMSSDGGVNPMPRHHKESLSTYLLRPCTDAMTIHCKHLGWKYGRRAEHLGFDDNMYLDGCFW